MEIRSRELTYCAALGIASSDTTVLSVGILARSRQVTLNLNGTLVFGIGSGRVLEDGEPGLAILGTNAKVDGCVVSVWLTRRTPLATLFLARSNRVEIILC